MKLVADIYVDSIDTTVSYVHSKEFDFVPGDDHVLGLIQDVVYVWESRGFAIDQGGDDTNYEFNFADGTETVTPQVMQHLMTFINEVADALKDYLHE
jgi:hypothetical protein